jgi:hypothetical protein
VEEVGEDTTSRIGVDADSADWREGCCWIVEEEEEEEEEEESNIEENSALLGEGRDTRLGVRCTEARCAPSLAASAAELVVVLLSAAESSPPGALLR